MKKILIFLSLVSNLIADQKFTVVGAGPAGIVVVGLLLDLCVPGDKITWIDPEFNVGDLSKYPKVSANTKNKLFVDFLNSCKAFKEVKHESLDLLNDLDFEKEYKLNTIIEPLKIITNHLKSKVNIIQGKLSLLFFENENWNLEVDGTQISSSHVILATGSHPKKIDIDKFNCKEISLIDALDKSKLRNLVEPEDTVGVVGNAHSAILILKALSELSVKKIISFYRGEIKYTQDMGGWLLNTSSGLKGVAAEWAKNVLETNPPANLIRVESNKPNLDKYLQECTKIIQAIGFERNNIPYNQTLSYDDKTGVIAPRLFGIGIAFPEKYVDPLGNVEHKVGLNSFMEYAQKIVPDWIKTKGCHRQKYLENFSELFDIEIL